MGVEFQLDYQDHPAVEDYLARSSAGIGAIILHSKSAPKQRGAAEAAIAAGIDVLFDPRTDRLAHEGFSVNGLPGYREEPYDLRTLAGSLDDRQRLVDAVLSAHPDYTTLVTPPFFYAPDLESARLNLALAEQASLATGKRVRPVLLLRSKMSLKDVETIAREYGDAGFADLDLRFTPLGGEFDGIPKIRAVLAAADRFRTQGMRVVLGRSGNIGQAAFALGHVHGYTVGIGQMEHVNHASDINRQKQPPKFDEQGKRKGGAWQGVYLPALALSVSMKRAQSLLGHSDVRTRLACREGACATSLLGPTTNHKAHYMHSRAGEMQRLLETPAAWRPKLETDRLVRAIELRELVNSRYGVAGEAPIKTRTLQSLVDGMREVQEARAA